MRLHCLSCRRRSAEVKAMSRDENGREGLGYEPQGSRALALRYTVHGWAVLPCSPDSKAPLTAHGFKDATTNADRVNEFWAASPTAMIGIATGKDAGIFVLDIDVDGEMGKDGLADLADLESHFHELPVGNRVRTPRGGLHLYFQYPAGLPVRSKAALVEPEGRQLSMDVRGDGGYVIAAGSIRKDGAAYEAVDAAWPPLAPEAPQWLLELVVGRKRKPAKQRHGDRSDLSPIGGTPYGLAALSSECSEVRTAPAGNRNHRLNTAACKLAQFSAAGHVDEGTARAQLMAAASEAGLDEDPNCGLSGIRKTIESGFQAGKEKPGKSPTGAGASRRSAVSVPPIRTIPKRTRILSSRRMPSPKESRSALADA